MPVMGGGIVADPRRQQHGVLSSGASAAYIPETLGLWGVKADSLALSDGDPVATWTDEKGNHNLTAAGGARPTYKATAGPNSKPTVRFDGVANLMKTGTFAFSQPCHVFIVFKNFLDAFSYVYSGYAGFGTAMYFGNLNTCNLYAGNAYVPGTGLGGSAFNILRAFYNGASSTLHKNNTSLGATGNAGSNAGDGIALGGRYDTSLFSQVDVSEMWVCAPNLGASDIAAMEGALADKYAITLS